MKEVRTGCLVLNQNLLKWIAVITMTIDHAGMVLFEQFHFMRLIGRLAFPIYCYLLVQGFLYTKSRTRYMLRMAVFAFFSELPFDLVCFGGFSWQGQSVFVTLLLGLMMLAVMEKILSVPDFPRWAAYLLTAAAVVVTALISFLTACDYSFSAPFLIAGLYVYVSRRRKETAGDGTVMLYAAYFVFLAAMFVGWILKGYTPEVSLNGSLTEAFCLPAVWLIQHSTPTRKKRSGKYFFYLYYPLHLLILYGIDRMWMCM